jgi:tRNA nucleotidyltransferase (CCA-adding enzyme)
MFQKTVEYIKKLEELLKLELYLVGGAVRDLILENPTKDFDFTTPSTPDEIEQKIQEAGFKVHALGRKFGTLGFKYEGDLIEITTFRNENYSNGSRKPEVEFHSDIRLDLARRDFTINAMAISSKGDLIDLFGGEDDLKNGIIKCVGDPDQRFEEDALRMLRAIRFAGQYRFNLDGATSLSIKNNFWRLLSISKERWVMEMDKILSLPDPSVALDLFKNLGLAQVVLPEILLLDYDFHKFANHDNYWLQTKLNIIDLNALKLDLRWAALLAQCAKPFLLSNYLQQNYHIGILGDSKLEIEVKDFVNKIEINELMESEYAKKFAVESALKIGIYLKFSNKRLTQIKEFILS